MYRCMKEKVYHVCIRLDGYMYSKSQAKRSTKVDKIKMIIK